MVYTINPHRTALLVIDVQKEYFKPASSAFIPSAPSVLPNILHLIDLARKHSLLVVYIKHLNRADGTDIGRMNDFGDENDPPTFVEGTPEVELIDELTPRAGEPIVLKRRYSAFWGTDLETVLRTKDINTVIICGYMTSFCSETTARDAHSRDYQVLFVSDANEGPDLSGPNGEAIPHQQVLMNTITALANGFAEVVSTSEVESRLK